MTQKLFVLVWNYGPPVAPCYSNIGKAKGQGKFMVYSREYADMASKEHTKMYGNKEKFVTVVPLEGFLKGDMTPVDSPEEAAVA